MSINYRILGIISEKDKYSKITSCNDVFLKYAGVKTDEKILGYTDYDFPWQEYADIYRDHELDALAGNHYSTIIPLKDYTNENRLFLHTKIQKKNAENEVVGVSCHAIEIINPSINRLLHFLLKDTRNNTKQFFINREKNSFNLSRKEKDILFFLLKGKTAKTTAKILGLTVKNVLTCIEYIKIKFNCRTESQLIKCAIANGYAEDLPSLEKLEDLIDKIDI